MKQSKADKSAAYDRFERAYPLNTDSIHAADILKAGGSVRFYLINMCQLDTDQIAAMIPVMIKEMATRQVVPIFVTDLLDFRVFREAGVIFEAVPPLADSADLMPDRDWTARRAQVLDLIRDKWQPAGEVTLDDDTEAGRI